MEYLVSSPCRIDLAGGTLDLWPLYLHHGGLELVHMAVEIRATAKLTGKKAPAKKGLKLHVRSDDLGVETTYKSLAALEASLNDPTSVNPLRWVNRVACAKFKEYDVGGEWTLRTSSQTPPGSGLGGSSVLGVSLSKAFDRAFAGALPKTSAALWKTQTLVRDLEAVEIEHPAGDQDYVPALFGGLLIFHLDGRGRSVERLSDKVALEISKRTALLYTGKPHHSGINNWQVFKAYHDGDPVVRSALRDIRALSSKLAGELRARRIENVGEILNEEWGARKRLAPAVNAPVLEDAWAFAKTQGATARKACGAGGGGCLLVWFDDPKAKERALKTPMPSSDWRWLPTELALDTSKAPKPKKRK